jgi:hypothetical protein
MSTILAHMLNEKLYLPILQNIGDKTNVIATVLHECIFDVYHKIKPQTLILPLQEYSQEFHDFIDQFKDKLNIIIYAGSIDHPQLFDYFNKNGIKVISGLQSLDGNNVLRYEYLYDENTYSNLKQQRNDKILVMLSNDLDKNHKLLDNILYPNTKLKICLINNHQFKHEQNIGVTNTNDLCTALNTFSEFIDIDNNFYIESSVCGINNISLDGDLLANITNHKYTPPLQNIDKYTVKNFVNTQALSFIGA